MTINLKVAILTILIKLEEDLRIFGFTNGEITEENVEYMEKYIETMPKMFKLRYAINFANVKKVCAKFYEFLNKFRTMICSLNADLLTYFMLSGIVNHIPVYLSEGDLIENRRQVVKRNFYIV